MIDVDAARAALAAIAATFDQAKEGDDRIALEIVDVRRRLEQLETTVGFLHANDLELAARVAKLERAAVPAMRLASPLYVRADAAGFPIWQRLIALGPSKVGLLVFNPSTGVGSVADANYQRGVAAARAAGIVVGVYVPTNWLDKFGYSSGAGVPAADGVPRGPAQVQNILDEISRAHAFYAAAGCTAVFLDEMNTKALPEVLAAYGKVRDHIRALFGSSALVVQNPGTGIAEAAVGVADVFMRFEGSGAKYLAFTPPTWHANHPGKWWDCVAPIDAATSWQSVLEAARRNKPALLWITDDADSNRDNSVPTFLDPLAAAL